MRKNPIDSSALFIGHFGIAAITVGMLLSGIFDIAGYGVPDYMPAYYAAGAGLCMVCLILTVILTGRKRKKSAETADAEEIEEFNAAVVETTEDMPENAPKNPADDMADSAFWKEQ